MTGRHLWWAAIAFVAAIASGAQAAPPTAKLVTAPLVTPAAAWTFYGSATTHTAGIAAWSDYTPEIKALGRTLGAGRLSADAYALNVRDYVRNNINVEFRFGLGKGGRGALIDQSGTPFDQAELMVKLLRYGGVTASYQVGTITLSSQAFGQWTGLVKGLNQATQTFTVDAKAACQFLADGGIPATVNGASDCASLSGDLTTVTLAHIWVSANGKLYDPSFKQHELVNGIDLPAAMGCGSAGASTCGSQVSSAVMSGAISSTVAGSSALQNLNFTGAGPTVSGQAVALANSIQGTDRSSRMIDVVGGKAIAATPDTPSANLAYVSATQSSWAGDIPDQYRTTMTVQAPACASITFFADEIAARRVSYTGSGGGAVAQATALYVDGVATPSSCGGTSTTNQLAIDVNHPYAASAGAYGDDHAVFAMVEPARVTTGVWEGFTPQTPNMTETSTAGSFPVTLVHAFGSASTSAQQFMSDLQAAAPVMTTLNTCRPSSTTPVGNRTCENDKQPLAAESISPLRTLSSQIVAGVTGTAITRHHDVGVIFSSRKPGMSYVTVQEVESITSRTSDSAARGRAFEIDAATLSSAESAAAADDPTFRAGQALRFFSSYATGPHVNTDALLDLKFINVVGSANMAAVLASLPDTAEAGGFEPWRKTLFQGAADAGFSTIMVAGGDGEIFSSSTALAYTTWESLKGGTGTSDPVASVMRTTELANAASLRRKEMSVSIADGSLSVRATPDLVTGSGEFPFSLPFFRAYSPSGREIERTSVYFYADQTGQGQGMASNSTSLTVHSGTDSASYSRLGGGWIHNYDVTAVITGNPAKALGEDRALDASSAIASVVVLNDLLANPTFANRITAAWTLNSFEASLYGNSIIVRRGAQSEAFVRLPSGSYTAADASSAKVEFSGSAQCLCGNLLYTGSAGDQIAFVSSLAPHVLATSGDPASGSTPQFVATSWTFPNGVILSFQYQWNVITTASNQNLYCYWGGCSNPTYVSKGMVLTGVSNNLGRLLSFTRVPVSDVYGYTTVYRISAVTDENGRTVTYSVPCTKLTCDSFTATDPNGLVTKYEYAADANSPDPSLIERPGYRLRRLYTPSNTTTPYRTVAYDELFRIKSVTDILGRQTQYFPGAVAGTELWKRADVVSPLNEVTTTVFNQRNSAIQGTDPLGRVTTSTYDKAGRLARTTNPEGDSVEQTYDVRSNVLTVTRHAKPGSGLADIVASTTYVEGPTVFTCANYAICNKPASETNARGFVTNYSWDAYGDLTQILAPADSAGVRPQTDLAYGLFGANGDVRLLSSKTEKVTGSQTLVTTYAYDAGNHFVLQSATVDSGSGRLNLRSCFKFDAMGNLVSSSDPRTASCP